MVHRVTEHTLELFRPSKKDFYDYYQLVSLQYTIESVIYTVQMSETKESRLILCNTKHPYKLNKQSFYYLSVINSHP
jgi:hypothetical protein